MAIAQCPSLYLVINDQGACEGRKWITHPVSFMVSVSAELNLLIREIVGQPRSMGLQKDKICCIRSRLSTREQRLLRGD